MSLNVPEFGFIFCSTGLQPVPTGSAGVENPCYKRTSAILFFIAILWPFVSLAAPTTQPYLLHLPGIGGHLPIDDHLLLGLREGGVDGWLEMHDWTGTDRGLIVLMQNKRHGEE